jgi:hypothetical protein
VIVICPSCGTPYSHAVEERSSARIARCSRCSFTFPMPGARSYRIEEASLEAVSRAGGERRGVPVTVKHTPAPESTAAPLVRPAGNLAIGMDDPTLESRLERTVLEQNEGQPRRAMTYWVMSDDGPEAPSAPQDSELRAATPAPASSVENEEATVEAGAGIEPWMVPTEGTPAQRAVLTLVSGAGAGIAWGAAMAAVADGSMWRGAAIGFTCGVALAGGVLGWRARKR